MQNQTVRRMSFFIPLSLLVGVFVFLTYTTFFIPEFVYIAISKDEGKGLHLESNPPGLHENPRLASRFSSIMFGFKNNTQESCEAVIASGSKQRQYSIEPDEPAGVVFAYSGKVNVITFCGESITVDLRR